MPCPICQKEHSLEIQEILNRLAGTPRRLEKLTASTNPRRLSARPAPEKWSAREIICHLADCELVYGMRYRKILAEPDPTLVPFDQEAWAEKLEYRSQPVKSALTAFSSLRNANISLFKLLSKESWEKAGMHPEYGRLTLRQIAGHLVDHDLNHLAQVERLLPQKASVAKKTKPKAKPKAKAKSDKKTRRK